MVSAHPPSGTGHRRLPTCFRQILSLVDEPSRAVEETFLLTKGGGTHEPYRRWVVLQCDDTLMNTAKLAA